MDDKVNQVIDAVLDDFVGLNGGSHSVMHLLIIKSLPTLTHLLMSVDWEDKITKLIRTLTEEKLSQNMLTEKKSGSNCRLFVGNLSPLVTSDTLKTYFGRHAKIEKASIECSDITYRSKGYGFLDCAASEDVEKVFSSAPHYVDGRWVTVRYARSPDFEEKARRNCLELGYALKVFSVPIDANHQDILRTFSQFGSIVEVRQEPARGCFQVIFGTLEGRERALEEEEHRVCNQIVQCVPDDTSEEYNQPIRTGILRVGEVLASTTQADLRAYFSRFSYVEKVRSVGSFYYFKLSSWMDAEHVMAFDGSLCCKGNYLTVARVPECMAIKVGVLDYF